MIPKKPKDPNDYLRTWLDHYHQASAVAPEVQKMYEVQQWERQTLERKPAAVSSISVEKIERWNEVLYDRLEANLPMLPVINPVVLTDVSSTATATSSVVLGYLEEASALETPEAVEYAEQGIEEYRALQEAHQKPERIKMLLRDKFPSLSERFGRALDSYWRWKSGQTSETGAAIDMRTFVDGLKGQLWEDARQHPAENMTNERMVERLFSSVPTEKEVREVLNQQSGLVSALSEVGKDRDAHGKHKLEVLWSRVLDHSFLLLNALP